MIERARPGARRLALSLLLLFGGLATAASECGTAPIARVTTAPATTLSLRVEVREDPDGTAAINAVTSQPGGVGNCSTMSKACTVALTGGQSLTVNGTRFPNIGDPQTAEDASDVRIPQPPPGGSYAFVYTDEHGRQTRFSLLAGGIAIAAPATGQTIPIPSGPRGIPTPTAPFGPDPRTPDLAHQPLTIRYTLPTVPPWPNGADPIVWGDATCSASAYAPQYGCMVTGSDQQATGVYTLTDAGKPYGYGFENFQPGPGIVSIGLRARWTPEPSGFADLQVSMDERAQSHITWSAA